MQRVRVPRTIDKPIMLLFWSLDEMIVITLMMGIGIFIDKLIIFMLLGFFVAKQYTKVIDGKLRLRQLHYAYAKGAALNGKSRTLPKTSIREYIS